VEAELLWEYAKLAQNLRMVTQKTRLLHEEPDKHMLAKLRILEKKMGLVLTLFKASVWGVINEQQNPLRNTTTPVTRLSGVDRYKHNNIQLYFR